MRRGYPLRRRLLALCSGLSLLLCAILCILWARSFSWYDRVMWASPGEYSRVQSLNGRLVFEVTSNYPLKNESSVTSERVGDDLRGFDWAVGLADG